MSKTVSLDKLIMLTGDLPPMPQVARRIMEIVNDPATNAQALQSVISRDQGMSGQIMKIANSALYSRSRKIETLSDAIVMLGFNSIKNIAIMRATKNLLNFNRKGRVISLKDKLTWEHSVGTALAGRIIARRTQRRFAERAFMAGLLHDIGKMVLLQKVADQFDGIIEEVYNTGRHFTEVEQEKFGFTHAEIGALLVKKWNLSEELEKAIRLHHEIKPEMKVDTPLVYFIDLANKFCHKIGVGFIKEPDLELKDELSAIMLGVKEEDIGDLEKSIQANIKEEIGFFQ
jgi:putative nucleotidyltransferase with HDIG domain